MKRGIASLFLGFILCAQPGCATTDRRIPPAAPAGGTGVVYLATGTGGLAVCKRTVSYRKSCQGVTRGFLEVKIKNDAGVEVGSTFPRLSPEDVFLDVFSRELNSTGFSVKRVVHLPHNVAKGIEIARVRVDIDKSSGLLTTTGACTVHVDMNLYQNGTVFSHRSYEVRATDYVFQDSDALPAALLHEATQAVVKQVVPEITRKFAGSRQGS